MGIKYNGTMFYPAKNINSRIKELEFRNKKDNIIGLQLADDGGNGNIDKFGLKIIP